MTEHISDEYFVTREVVTYNGSALVSGEKDLVVEECYQLVVNGKGAGEITCSPWDKKEAFLGYLYLRGYISGAGDVRTIDVDEEHGMANITIREYLTNVTDMENLLSEDEVLLNEQGVIPKRDDVRLSSYRWCALCSISPSWNLFILQRRYQPACGCRQGGW